MSTEDDPVMRLVERSYAGDPDNEDTIFEAKVGCTADELDTNGGMLLFLPLVPFTGRDMAHALGLLDQVRAETGVRCAATLNALNPDVVDLVVGMRFPGEELAAGHRALDLAHKIFAVAGYAPYRLDVDHPNQPGPERDFVRTLKDFLDPNQVIAPGRYH